MTEQSKEFWRECVELRPALIRIAARAGAGEVAEDLVHEAFIRAMEFPALDTRRLTPFLKTVVRRLCVDEARRSTTARRVAAHTKLQPLDVIDPAEAISDQAEAAWLVAHCGKLSRRERCVLLWLSHGLPHDEISRRLGTTRRATECIASRARGRVRQWMAHRASGTAG
ncbi:RNA polymerase sigma factor [Allokutzneria albata]|uniref:RNA polymerase sigma-70 factor, ECF subfamily n=1 Tax=Allokutzneria albata TaxID=211114 RepID=A0A1G9U959_ALLAB|nr:sigma-70 family RNA polymerase sigma factor [Allokutzneria albata]SDM56438.1 RNA polymerase sigma-70 factor, ECF subfamily [Allokutzneria albata]